MLSGQEALVSSGHSGLRTSGVAGIPGLPQPPWPGMANSRCPRTNSSGCLTCSRGRCRPCLRSGMDGRARSIKATLRLTRCSRARALTTTSMPLGMGLEETRLFRAANPSTRNLQVQVLTMPLVWVRPPLVAQTLVWNKLLGAQILRLMLVGQPQHLMLGAQVLKLTLVVQTLEIILVAKTLEITLVAKITLMAKITLVAQTLEITLVAQTLEITLVVAQVLHHMLVAQILKLILAIILVLETTLIILVAEITLVAQILEITLVAQTQEITLEAHTQDITVGGQILETTLVAKLQRHMMEGHPLVWEGTEQASLFSSPHLHHTARPGRSRDGTVWKVSSCCASRSCVHTCRFFREQSEVEPSIIVTGHPSSHQPLSNTPTLSKERGRKVVSACCVALLFTVIHLSSGVSVIDPSAWPPALK